MDFRGGEKHVYTAALSCRFNRLAGRIDVSRHAARETTNYGSFDFARNRLHRGEVAFANDGESCFDDVHPQSRKLPRNLQLLPQVHGSARALLAIAERRVEDTDSIIFHSFVLLWRGSVFFPKKKTTPALCRGVL